MEKTILAALGRWLRRRWSLWLLLVTLLFLFVPSLDLTISGWFWSPESGWPYARAWLPELIRKKLPPVMIGLGVLPSLLWLIHRVFLLLRRRGEQARPMVRGKVAFYLLASLAVGPGILANSVFKDHWHRARPSQIVEFGGQALYSPPLWVTDQCATNCSFVSGHASLGFWALAFAFLAPVAWRGRAIVAAFLFGCGVGVSRIAQGGHFFSDVVYAAILVISVTWILWKMLIAPPVSSSEPPPR